MAEDHCTSCLIESMDRLWFQKQILNTDEIPSPRIHSYSSSNVSLSSFLSEELLLSPSSFQDYSSSSGSLETEPEKESETKITSNLKDPSTRKSKKNSRSKSFAELELDELKGFMDLGFEFRRENLNNRLILLIPGLRRLDEEQRTNEVGNEYGEETKIMRPYLSESWLVRSDDSWPSLNLVHRISNPRDLKRQLRVWARIVASSIQPP